MEQICRITGVPFAVLLEDQIFYEKVSPLFRGKKYQIPLPTLCPNERQRRRMAWRNDRNLFHRECDISGKELITMFHPSYPGKVIDRDIWWGDSWDALEYGRKFDFTKSFFPQFHELFLSVPLPHIITVDSENARYTNYNAWNKNCYLCFGGNNLQDSLYCYMVNDSRNCIDCLFTYDSELCSECVQCHNCYNLHFGLHNTHCHDSAFLEDCAHCENCFLCWNLQHQKYCILNTQYSEEEYWKKRSQYDLSSHADWEKTKKIWQQERSRHVKRATKNIGSENVMGEYIAFSKNCRECYIMAKNCEDCAHVVNGFPSLKDSQDCTYCGENVSWCYEILGSGADMREVLFSTLCLYSKNLLYCQYVMHSEHCFGCVGLRHKKYCIFNRQYTKEEYEKLVPKILTHMQETKEWGEFFPIANSPFAYNQTVAQEYFPLAKDEIEKRGWQWRKPESFDTSGIQKKIPAKQLPDTTRDIPDDILNWALECAVSGRLFRIQKSELDACRSLQLPIPHLHSDERHRRRTQLLRPRQFWQRSCDFCGTEIQTSYPPDSPEKVYCQDCYRREIYS